MWCLLTSMYPQIPKWQPDQKIKGSENDGNCDLDIICLCHNCSSQEGREEQYWMIHHILGHDHPSPSLPFPGEQGFMVTKHRICIRQ